LTINAADLFCGAGGTSTGFVQACKNLGFQPHLTAVNHWEVAIKTHRANHEEFHHICSPLEDVLPNDAHAGKVDVLFASPECTHFSRARGGRPVLDQKRSTAWWVIEWIKAKQPSYVVVENVAEFLKWGPISEGQPIKELAGTHFEEWFSAFADLGYHAEYRILNSADFGAPTSRSRFFLIAASTGEPIPWPSPTHRNSKDKLNPDLPVWNSVRSCIDFSITGESIYGRKRPLAPKTLRRIEVGLERYGGKFAEPFLIVLRNHMAAQSLGDPAKTITAGGGHLGLVEPVLIKFHGGSDQKSNRSCPVDGTIQTIDTQNRFGVAEAVMIHTENFRWMEQIQ
jgi:DNA (cytosine-5)-methyltransferase 1